MVNAPPDDTGRTPEYILTDLANLRQRPVLCIYHGEGENIDRGCLNKVLELLPRLGEHSSLCVVLDSPGGDIEDAFRIANATREYADDVEVLVPQWAKSAATLICLSANRIHISPQGELGPLDPQIPDPSTGASWVSSLESFNALEHVRTNALDTLTAMIDLFLDEMEIEAPFCYEHAKDLFPSVVFPLYQQINPYLLGRAGMALEMSDEYAFRVMSRWSYTGLGEEEINNIIHALVWGYPSHGFVIDLREARELGLNAQVLDPEPNNLCQELLRVSPSLVELVLPAELPTIGEDHASCKDN